MTKRKPNPTKPEPPHKYRNDLMDPLFHAPVIPYKDRTPRERRGRHHAAMYYAPPAPRKEPYEAVEERLLRIVKWLWKNEDPRGCCLSEVLCLELIYPEHRRAAMLVAEMRKHTLCAEGALALLQCRGKELRDLTFPAVRKLRYRIDGLEPVGRGVFRRLRRVSGGPSHPG